MGDNSHSASPGSGPGAAVAAGGDTPHSAANELTEPHIPQYPILWWTPWFDDYERYEGMVIDNCGLPYTCRHTLDRSMYAQSNLVVFHMFNKHDVPPLEDVNLARKAWVFNTAERPQELSYSPKWISKFTYSWTHHFNSDFIESYFWAGHVNPAAFINLVSRPPLIPLDRKNKHRLHGFHPLDRQPLAPVAWIVSNCKADNGRHYMINQLQKYIKVDIYGHCISNRFWPKKEDGITDMSSEELVSFYKFYLAVENTNCEDYVTEKLERTFAAGTVPVVDGPKDYSRFRPAKMSLIEYNDFGNPKDLATYLTELDRDDEAYSEYLTFRSKRTKENTDEIGRVLVDQPSTFNQDYKTRLLPWFVDNWDLDTSLKLTDPTTEWLSPDIKSLPSTGRQHTGAQWGPDMTGARCGLCRLARNLAERDEMIQMERRLKVDTTCEFRKHYQTQWILEFYAYWILFGMVLLAGVLSVVLSRQGRAKLAAGWKTSKFWIQSRWGSAAGRKDKSQYRYKGILEQ